MKKRSVRIKGHATSVSLEAPFWDSLKELAEADDKSINQLIAEIDAINPHANLSSAIRIYVLRRIKESR